jgi:fermentation-respiration switch protein FrsA (DUF1100 family)
MKPIRWRRVIGLTTLSLVLIAVSLDILLAWIYVWALTRPGCPTVPQLPKDTRALEQVHLPTSDGRQIPAWYFPTKNGAAVVALGGSGGALGAGLPPIENLLAHEFGVLQIGSRACGDPQGPVSLGYLETDDALAGLKFLQNRVEVDPERVGVFGFSMGGVAAIRAAARDPGFKAVMAEGGYFNLGADIIEEGHPQPPLRRFFLLTIAGMYWFQTGINPWESSPIDDLPTISPRPVQLIYGELEVADGRADDQFAEAREPKSLWIVPGGSHGTNYSVATQEYDELILDFFSTHLLAPAP